MSILICGMDIPKEGNWRSIRIYPDGTIGRPIGFGDYALVEGAKAVPIPPHGRLGDLDAAVELAMQYCPDDDGSCPKAGSDLRELLDEIEILPTIIPAEEGEA